MCDASLQQGSCVTVVMGSLFATAFGFVGEMLNSEFGLVIGVSFGASLGTLATAFPDGPNPRLAFYVFGSAVTGSFLALFTRSDLPVAALFSSVFANGTLFSSAKIHAGRRRHQHQRRADLAFLAQEEPQLSQPQPS